MNKIKFLIKKGLKDGDKVRFKVENQCSGVYFGPLSGTLRLRMDANEAHIEAIHEGKPCIITINEGYDAYIDTIEKIDIYSPYLTEEPWGIEKFPDDYIDEDLIGIDIISRYHIDDNFHIQLFYPQCEDGCWVKIEGKPNLIKSWAYHCQMSANELISEIDANKDEFIAELRDILKRSKQCQS